MGVAVLLDDTICYLSYLNDFQYVYNQIIQLPVTQVITTQERIVDCFAFI